MLLEHVLDLGREYRVAAVLDHVLLAAGELDEPEPAAPGEVAGAQPALVTERSACLVLVPVVAAHQRPGPDRELTDLASADVVTGLVDDPHAIAGKRQPHEPAKGQRQARRQDLHRRAAAELDHAVAVDESGLAHGAAHER